MFQIVPERRVLNEGDDHAKCNVSLVDDLIALRSVIHDELREAFR
jgi:hypothetical protein